MPSDGGNASLVYDGDVYGPCIGLSAFETAPSCSSIQVGSVTPGMKSLATSSKLLREFSFLADYPASDTRDLNLLVTFSYGMTLKDVR